MRERSILCGTMQFGSGWRRVRVKLTFSSWHRMQAHQYKGGLTPLHYTPLYGTSASVKALLDAG